MRPGDLADLLGSECTTRKLQLGMVDVGVEQAAPGGQVAPGGPILLKALDKRVALERSLFAGANSFRQAATRGFPQERFLKEPGKRRQGQKIVHEPYI